METSSLKSALKKAKRKQLLKTIIISTLVVLISIPVLYKTGNHFAAKGSAKLHNKLFLYHQIAQPNVNIDSQVTSSSSTFGGNITTNRSKNINGYIVPWSTLTSPYDWIRSSIDFNEIIPSLYWSDTQYYEYDKQTKNKSATFYHPENEKYSSIPNELAGVTQLDNHVAEVAISFDQPYTFQEIQAQIPNNLNTVWLYLTSEMRDEKMGPVGMPVYGFNPGDEPDEAYGSFVKALQQYDPKGHIEGIQQFLEMNKDKSFDEVKVLGMMLTGQTQNFKALENQDFIRAASVGATAPIVPYIEPEK
ncbi:hypothetical protein BEP19_12030 [Ammoniphilus oxalaticus]|uniref:Sigma factor regulator C-terminal domain-containing protein n=1 Tax=Ammoniphilus oxalaticus TaxID=66863 RepID=A0A419SGM8_9BACL|nr:sigma factor regulator N-terminal domain-containing protein [Ammoniphilus oxalaticus]RKD22952.1 hypothetical protein BEP19_12030 [Ammoniphilus oxalaticus]